MTTGLPDWVLSLDAARRDAVERLYDHPGLFEETIEAARDGKWEHAAHLLLQTTWANLHHDQAHRMARSLQTGMSQGGATQRGSIYLGIAVALVVMALLAAGGWRAYKTGEKHGKAEVQQAWDADKAKRMADALDAETKARTKEQQLQAQADAQRKAANAKIQTLNRDLGVALDELRNRPERPAAGSDVPKVAGTGTGGCTGADLYRPDAEAFVRLAADADRIRIALATCQAAYTDARALK
jgi:hypothetical protein